MSDIQDSYRPPGHDAARFEEMRRKAWNYGLDLAWSSGPNYRSKYLVLVEDVATDVCDDLDAVASNIAYEASVAK